MLTQTAGLVALAPHWLIFNSDILLTCVIIRISLTKMEKLKWASISYRYLIRIQTYNNSFLFLGCWTYINDLFNSLTCFQHALKHFRRPVTLIWKVLTSAEVIWNGVTVSNIKFCFKSFEREISCIKYNTVYFVKH